MSRTTLPFIVADKIIYALDGVTQYDLHLLFELRGELDPERLGQAVGCALARSPVLRATAELSALSSRWRVLEVPHHDQRLRVVEAGAETEARAAIDRIVNERIDITRQPAVRFSLVRCSPRHSILVLKSHHCPVDVTAMLRIVSDLKEAYEDLSSARSPDCRERPMARSRARLLRDVSPPTWLRVGGSALRHRWRFHAARRNAHLRFSGRASSRVGFSSLSFRGERWRALAARRKTLQASTSELFLTAVAVAAHRFNGAPDNRREAYAIVVPVDLRRYCRGRQSPRIIASFVGGTVVRIDTRAAADFDAALREVCQQSNSIQAGRLALLPNIFFPLIALLPARLVRRLLVTATKRWPQRLIPTCSIAYLGRGAERLRSIGHAEIVGFTGISTGTVPVGLNVSVSRVGKSFTLTLSYLADACPAPEVDALLRQIDRVLLPTGPRDG